MKKMEVWRLETPSSAVGQKGFNQTSILLEYHARGCLVSCVVYPGEKTFQSNTGSRLTGNDENHPRGYPLEPPYRLQTTY